MNKSGCLIKRKRKLLNLTQMELSIKIGCSNQHLWNWENGKALTPNTYTQKLCKELKMRRSVLIDYIINDIRNKFYGEV